MKNALVCLVVFITLTMDALGAGFHSIHSPNGVDVWAVGNGGAVFHSYDGGVTWTNSTQGTSTLRAVYTRDTDIWIVGDNGVCNISTDGGGSWINQTLAGAANLRAVAFANSEIGLIAGSNGVIIKSTDTGSSWFSKSSNTTQQLNSLAFSDPLTAYVAGAAGTLLKTTDAGESWTNISPIAWTKDILSVSVSDQTVYVAGVDGFCYKSTNGGAIWNALNFKTDTKVDVNDVFAVTPANAYFVGGGGFIRNSTNGGLSYSYGIHQMHAKLNDLFFFSLMQGWACSEKNNAILRTTDAGVTWQLPQGTTVNYQWVNKFSGSSIGNTFCVNPWNKNIVYVVMGGGAIWMSGDRGDSWSQTATISTGGSTWSFYVSPKDTNLWIAATSGGGDGIRRSTNRGITWTTTILRNFTSYGMPLEMDPDQPDTVIFAPDGASGSNGIVYISKNFGASWDTLTQTSFRSPCDIVIVPGNTKLWYVGDGVTGSGSGQMWRSTDYGKSWNSIYSTTGSEIPMIAVSRLRNTTAFATAWGSGGYNKTTDEGVTWPVIASTGSTWGTDIAKDDPNVVLYGTYGGGTSYLSTNAGTTFNASPLSGSNSGMLCYDRSTFIAHQTGGVWKYNITYTVPLSNAQVLTVISPNGGENWSFNSVRNITWSAGNIPSVKIEYKTTPGGPWQTIAASVQGSLGAYVWTVPNSPTTQARVRISDASDTLPVDSSEANFSITVANITAPSSLVYGNVGIGQTRSDTLRISNPGTGPLVITSVTAGTSAFIPGRSSFTIAPGASDTLSVTFRPTVVQGYVDTLRISSNAVDGQASVVLVGAGVLVASVSVVAPNGGEIWRVGTVQNILWSSTLVNDLSLFYRVAPSSTWIPIATNIPAASGTYAWTVANSPGDAVVRVVDATNAAVLDESDDPFVIQPATSVVELGGIPISYELTQNYPNPFNPTTQITYGLPHESHVTLTIYNALGQEVIRLLDQNQPAGRYAVGFSATDGKGAALSSGIYYYSLRAGEFVDIKKMLLMK